MIALIANLALALLWLTLSQAPTLTSFIAGYFIGFILIAVFSKVLGGGEYVRRSIGFARFIGFFFVEFIQANLEVARLVLFVPTHRFKSGFLEYSIEELTFPEALLLFHCITLTPGTITTSFNWDKKILRIHILDYSKPNVVNKRINEKLKRNIWRFSR